MGFVFYEPRTREKRSLRSLRKVPAIKFSMSSIVVNVYARRLMEDNGHRFGPNLRVGFDPDTNAIRLESVEKGGIKLKKTKAYIGGMLKRFGLDWLVGQFIPVSLVGGGLEGYPVAPTANQEAEVEVETEAEDEIKAEVKTKAKEAQKGNKRAS